MVSAPAARDPAVMWWLGPTETWVAVAFVVIVLALAYLVPKAIEGSEKHVAKQQVCAVADECTSTTGGR
jgi:hypothetical protein